MRKPFKVAFLSLFLIMSLVGVDFAMNKPELTTLEACSPPSPKGRAEREQKYEKGGSVK